MHSHPGNIKNTKQASGYTTKGYLGGYEKYRGTL